jgi:hypothetical protein
MTPTIADIIAQAAGQEGYDPGDILRHCRAAEIVAVRRRAMWACRQLRPDVSLPRLGTAFGRHHTSVLQAVRECDAARGIDPMERAACDRVIAEFRDARVVPLRPYVRQLVEAAMSGLTPEAVSDHARVEPRLAKALLGEVAAACLRAAGEVRDVR